MAVITTDLVLSQTAAWGSSGFGDVNSEVYYADAVQWMVDESVTTGTTKTCYPPDRDVTRGETAVFV